MEGGGRWRGSGYRPWPLLGRGGLGERPMQHSWRLPSLDCVLALLLICSSHATNSSRRQRHAQPMQVVAMSETIDASLGCCSQPGAR